jgi:hypothetical protein
MPSPTSLALAGALLLAGLVVGCGGGDGATTTDTNAVSTLSSDLQHLGSAPGACRGPKPEVIPIESPLVEATGLAPVWFAVDGALLDSEGAIFYLSRDTRYTSVGWELLTVWVFDPREKGAITVTGQELGRNGGPILFAPRGGDAEPVPTLVLDAASASAAERLFEREVLVYIKGGSCFALEAERGGKRTRFVVGMGL